jgi:GT2 family glycosyltransferase
MFLAIRSEAFEAIGGFDERYHLYCEDVDLCARLRLAGWQLRQARDAVVVHDARRASRRSLRHLGWHLASMTRLWRSDAWRRYRALIASEGAPLPMRAPGRD